ncbi:hypothetical protein OUZ56_021030 [Daphnia magna]|uniref:Uncharacterized protein n=1 Tax=Daphnia magna TaxID=35525 RepID=A0ABQ9ZG64_9CRUS|nr:hypothetical protein OUZ56_021030 [Daphnia magna]
MMQHHQTGRPVAGASSNASNNSGNTVINRSKGMKSSREAPAASAASGSTAEAVHHHHHHNNNNNNTTLKGGAAVASTSAAASASNEFKTKTVLKEAVDAVVSSFAKHSQGYGRERPREIVRQRRDRWEEGRHDLHTVATDNPIHYGLTKTPPAHAADERIVEKQNKTKSGRKEDKEEVVRE